MSDSADNNDVLEFTASSLGEGGSKLDKHPTSVVLGRHDQYGVGCQHGVEVFRAEDPSALPHALGIIARSQNMSELARRVGVSRDGLYKTLSDEGNPTWSTILKVTNALGLS